MEPGYNDPDYWMRWYAEQQELQRARQEADLEPADEARFEQQLGELEVRSPEESSPEAVFPARSHENIQRTDVGGSMRMPPRSNLRDNSFSSTRYSVGVPHAHLGSAANDYRSDLRGRPFSSMRFAAPSEAQSNARTDDNKSRGLFSRVKSRLATSLTKAVAAHPARRPTQSIQSCVWISPSAPARRTWTSTSLSPSGKALPASTPQTPLPITNIHFDTR
ncbi:hypothetical protein ABH973_003808 [Bradyrhizobium ottawaense]